MFVWFFTMRGKQKLGRAIEIQIKMGVTTHFLEIIEQQFSQKRVKFNLIFSKLKLYYLRKMHGYLKFPFGYQEHLLSFAFSA